MTLNLSIFLPFVLLALVTFTTVFFANADHNSDVEDLLFAAEFGKIDLLQKYISTRKLPDIELAWQDSNPLLMAASHGKLEAVQLLLKAGVDPNVMSRDGTRPITTASFFGYTDVVKTLIDAGADLKFNDIAAGISNPLVVAASNDKIEVMKLLLDKGINVEAPTMSGDTALILAALEGKVNAVRLLLSVGANIEAKNHQKNTALIAAAYKGATEAVRVLLEHGANHGAKNKDTRVAISVAAEAGHNKIVRLLAKAGANVNELDKLGNSAMIFAARNNHWQCVQTLVEFGADMEVVDDMRFTALHHAHTHNHIKTVKILTLAGANNGPGPNHDGVHFSNIPNIDTCDWFRGLLKQFQLSPIQLRPKEEGIAPMKACEWIRQLGFDGSIVPLLDQVQLYGYKSMVRLFAFDLFGREDEDDDDDAVEGVKLKAYKDIRDLHKKEYRETYRNTDEDVIEEKLPSLLKYKFGANIELPDEKKEEEEVEIKEPEEILPQIHRPPKELRPEYAKDAPGEEELERLRLLHQQEKEDALAAQNEEEEEEEEEAGTIPTTGEVKNSLSAEL